MQISLGGLKTARLPARLRRLGEWWLKELLDLLPERVGDFFSGRGRALLAIAIDQDGATFELLNDSRRLIARERVARVEGTLWEIDQFLSSHHLERKDMDIGLRLPTESVFCRQLLLPAEAVDVIDTIVAQDLAKKTPFKAGDVYSDYVTFDHDAGGKIAVWQWITRRQYVEQALLPLNIAIEQVSFVMFNSSDADRPAPFIDLRPETRARSSWLQTAALGLSYSALGLALIAGGLKYWNQQAEMERLAAQITATSSKAQQVRTLVDQLREKKGALLHLRLERSEAPGLIDLWEEATRVLPSHSWLTEFRLIDTAGKRERQIAIVGLSSAAPSLVGIIDSSPLFFDAALTSPIAFDATEGRERFALQAKVKMPEALGEASQ